MFTLVNIFVDILILFPVEKILGDRGFNCLLAIYIINDSSILIQ